MTLEGRSEVVLPCARKKPGMWISLRNKGDTCTEMMTRKKDIRGKQHEAAVGRDEAPH